MSYIDQHGQNVGDQKNLNEGDYVAGDKKVYVNQQQSTPTHLAQIPEPVGDFVGREEDIAKLMKAFEDTGSGAVISGVQGMGGVGKTELAKVLAKRLKAQFPNAQLYFNLRGASDEDEITPATEEEVLSHVIRSFYPEEQLPADIESLQRMCHSVLENKQVLLLMDNALNAGQLGPMSPPPDGCALLVTSRHRFTLPKMDTLNLDTLPPEHAQELLLEICPRIGEAAGDLAKRCGYLPLALRLSASALKARPTLDVSKYSQDLSEEQGRLKALDKYQGATEVKVGVEASLGISYNLLNEDMQKFWRGLGVFPGDFMGLSAGEVSVIPDEQDAETALGDLYAASMVQWDNKTDRYRLHDLARDYARDQLDLKKERVDIERNHASHYLEILIFTNELYEKGGDSMMQCLALFDLERGNIEAGQFWASGRSDKDKTATKLCCAYPNAGYLFLDLRLHALVRKLWLEKAVEAARSLEYREAECNHLGNLGNSYRIIGDSPKAIECLEQALAISREMGNRLIEGQALGALGSAYYIQSNFPKAIEYYKKAEAISREMGYIRLEGQVLGNLGVAYSDLGDPAKAIEYYEQQLVISLEMGDRLSEGIVKYNMSDQLLKLNRKDEAIGFAEKAVEIYEAMGDPYLEDARAQLERIRALEC